MIIRTKTKDRKPGDVLFINGFTSLILVGVVGIWMYYDVDEEDLELVAFDYEVKDLPPGLKPLKPHELAGSSRRYVPKSG